MKSVASHKIGTMNVKEELLSILLENEEGISGSELAERIGCSRMAISKSAAGLADEGYRLSVSRSDGYKLEKSDVLSSQMLEHIFNIPVYYRPVVSSTMTEAKDLINKGADVPFAVVAGRQEGGRGRLGRSFFSPEGGVYMSIVLGGSSIPDPELLTTASCLATVKAIEALSGIGCSIKWVNDIYVHHRKAVGILTEGIVNMEEGGLDKAIIGVGINLQGGSDAIPSELKEKMIYLYPGGNVPFTRAELASRVADEILAIQGKEFIEEYKSRCFILGSEVTVIKNGKERQAIALDVDERARLVVRYPDGRIEALSSGEVSLRI